MTPDEAPTTTSASELTDARLVAAMREDREIRKATVDAIAALVVQILLLRSGGLECQGLILYGY